MRLAGSLALAVIAISARGAAAQPGWDVRVPERLELVAGAGGSLPITLTLDRGMSISHDAAITLDLQPDSAIVVKRRRLGRTDAVDPDADAPRFLVPLRTDTPGDFALRLRLRFWLCGQKVCRPVEARRNVTISVAAPAPPPPPPPAPSPAP